LSVDLPATGAQFRAPRRQLAGQHRHNRVVAQLIVIDHVHSSTVAQCDPENTLADQCRDRVPDQLLRPTVPGSKTGHHRALRDGCKPKPCALHSVWIGSAPGLATNHWHNTIFSESQARYNDKITSVVGVPLPVATDRAIGLFERFARCTYPV